MLSKLVTALLVVIFVGVAGGFVVLASWDVPVKQMPVEKTLDTSHFLEKTPNFPQVCYGVIRGRIKAKTPL